MDALIQDVRYALRALRARPSFTFVAIATLAIGIGATTAIFSVVRQVLLAPPPFEDPDRLFVLSRTLPRPTDPAFVGPWSYPDFELLRERVRSLDVAAFRDIGVSLSGDGEPERIDAEMVSPNYFTVLGVRPVAGRAFTTSDGAAGAAAVAVISHRLSQRRFGASAVALGEIVRINGMPFEIVGVAPEGFAGQAGKAALWVPIEQAPVVMADARRLTRPFSNWHNVIARMAGADASAAAVELDVVARALAELRQESAEEARGVALLTLRNATTDVRLGQTLLALFGAVGLVLLIACANLANLLLARAAGRRREIALRSALGASRVRLVRQLITESLVLSCTGALAGLAVAWTGISLLTRIRPAEPAGFGRIAGPPTFEPLVLDGHVLLFTLCVSLLAGVLFGLAPAFVAARSKLATLLRAAASGVATHRGMGRVRAVLVIGELAVALVLLAGAGLLGQSLLRLQRIETGIDAEGVVTAAIELPRSSHDAAQAAAFYSALIERVRALPGVRAASVATSLPLARNAGATSMDIAGEAEPDEPRIAGYHLVGAEYFAALGIPLERGRVFTERDRQGAPRVAILNRTAARLHFAGGDVLGRRVRLGVGYEPSDEYAEVVGIVGDVSYGALDEPVKPEAYLSYAQYMENRAYVIVRGGHEAAALMPAIARTVEELDPNLPLFDVQTMQQRVAAATSRPRFGATLLAMFAIFAVVLAAVGVYGVVAYSVLLRSREIGIRRALGADTRTVLVPILKEGAVLACTGIALGLIAAIAATRVLSSQLYDVRATDPPTLIAVVATLLATALLAAYIPSRRALRVDPATVLRSD